MLCFQKLFFQLEYFCRLRPPLSQDSHVESAAPISINYFCYSDSNSAFYSSFPPLCQKYFSTPEHTCCHKASCCYTKKKLTIKQFSLFTNQKSRLDASPHLPRSSGVSNNLSHKQQSSGFKQGSCFSKLCLGMRYKTSAISPSSIIDILLTEFRNFTLSSTNSSVLLDPHSFLKLFKMGKDGISIWKKLGRGTCSACSQSTTHGHTALTNPSLFLLSSKAD